MPSPQEGKGFEEAGWSEVWIIRKDGLGAFWLRDPREVKRYVDDPTYDATRYVPASTLAAFEQALLSDAAVEALMEAVIDDRGKELGAVDSDEASRWLQAAIQSVKASQEGTHAQ